MNIAFRVDGNKTLGLGHVKRCIVIAKKLQKNNISCIFITQFKEIEALLQSEGFVVFIIKKKNKLTQINRLLEKERCTKLIIDSKNKSIGKLLETINPQIKIILIDNFNHSSYADLLIISSVENPKKHYPQNSIVGIQYLLHGIDVLPKISKPKKTSILVTMGGSDKYDITLKIINSFLKNPGNFDLTIVLGKFYKHEKNLLEIISNDKRFTIIKNPPSLVPLMQKSTIGIVTFGITVYEAAICCLPLFVISHSNENTLSAKLVEKYGWINHLGKYDKINYTSIPNNVIQLTQNKIKLKKMKQACSQIDGLGPSRVSEKIINL